MAFVESLRVRGAGLSGAERERVLARIGRLARLLDTAFVIPVIRRRVGFDGLLGLVPGVGDAVTTAMSAYIVYEAWRLGAAPHVLLRMAGNVVLDAGIGVVPVVGDIADVLFKANIRNIRILQDHLTVADARMR